MCAGGISWACGESIGALLSGLSPQGIILPCSPDLPVLRQVAWPIPKAPPSRESQWPNQLVLGSAAVALWLSKKLVLAVEHSLSQRESGPVAGSGLGKLGKGLSARGIDIAELSAQESGPKNYSAILIEDIAHRDTWAEELPRLASMLLPAARLVSVDRGPAAEVSRRFLCGGLQDIRQQEIGRHILTSGRLP